MAALEVNVGQIVRKAISDQFRAHEPAMRVLGEVWEERGRQDEKWGEQNHPDLRPGLATYLGVTPGAQLDPNEVADYYSLPTAAEAKMLTDTTAAEGNCSWVAIATEELAEVVEAAAAGDEAAVRAEVIQLAAVCVQWAQAIDRRGGEQS